MAQYTYTYDLAGGIYNGQTSYKQTYDTNNPASSRLITPTRDGYKLRWFTIVSSSDPSQIGKNAAAGQQIAVAANITLRAIWDKQHLIRYELDGGYFASNWTYKQTKNYGSNVTLREAPTRTGYTFGGWKDHKNMYNGAIWSAGQTWGADVDCDLKAVWTRNSANTYRITVDLDGGTGAANQVLSIGTKYTLPTPTKSGYEFSHWISNRDNNYDGTADIYQAGSIYNKSNDVTFTAVWKQASSYNVLYYRPKTESGSGTAIAQGYDTQEESKTATSFTVTNGFTTYIFGHTFKGWFDHFIPQPIQNGRVENLFSFHDASLGYLHKTTGEVVDNHDTDEMTSDYIRVVAGQKYTYSYHMDYGKIAGSNKTPHPWTRLWFYDSSKALLANSMQEISEADNFNASGENTYHYEITAPSGAAYIRISSRYLRYGYAQFTNGDTFEAWSINDADLNNLYQAYDSFSNAEKKNVYLLGIYECNQRTITYNANGGTNAPRSQPTWYGETVEITIVVPTKDGCKFLGWSTDADAETASWRPGADFLGQNNDFVLYAVWKEINNININVCDGTKWLKGKEVYVCNGTKWLKAKELHVCDGMKWL